MKLVFLPEALDDIERLVRCRAIGEKSGRAVLLNEAHGLRKDSVRKLLVVLERIPAHVTGSSRRRRLVSKRCLTTSTAIR